MTMNEHQWSILVAYLDEVLGLMKGPPDDATCGWCRWFKDNICYVVPPAFVCLNRKERSVWEYPRVDETDPCCRQWRAK